MEPYVVSGYANQAVTTQAPKPVGLNGAIQGLLSEVSETMNLAENIASSLGISKPSDEGIASDTPGSPVDQVRMAMSALRIANVKLTDALQHINS